MKQVKLLLSTIAIFSIIIACKKDNNNPTTINIEGAWIGTWEFQDLQEPAGELTESFFSLHFHSDGRILVQMNDNADLFPVNSTGGAIGVGTWGQQGDSLVANYNVVLNLDEFINTNSFSLKLKKTAGNIVTGTIGIENNNIGFANFTLNKPPASATIGSWLGTYSYNNIPGAQNLPYALHFAINNDPNSGFIIVESTNPVNTTITSIGIGTWIRSGNSIEATCENFVNGGADFFVSGEINGSTLTGNFGLIQAGVKQPSQGNFQLQKK